MNPNVKYFKESPMSKSTKIAKDVGMPYFNSPQSQLAKQSYDPKMSQDDFSDQNKIFSFQDLKVKSKSNIIDFLKSKLKITAFTEQIFNSLQAIQEANNINKLFQILFNLIKGILCPEGFDSDNVKTQQEVKEVLMTIRSKQSAKLRLIRQEDQDKRKKSKSAKQTEDLEKVNQELKKELYNIKQEKTMQQKRLIGLIEQFKNRKSFYMAQIRKLTQIINMSSKDVRKLVLEKTKEAKLLEDKFQMPKKSNFPSKLRFQNADNDSDIIYDAPKSRTNNRVKTVYSNRREADDRQSSPGSYIAYNTQVKNLKNITSIQQIEDNVFQY